MCVLSSRTWIHVKDRNCAGTEEKASLETMLLQANSTVYPVYCTCVLSLNLTAWYYAAQCSMRHFCPSNGRCFSTCRGSSRLQFNVRLQGSTEVRWRPGQENVWRTAGENIMHWSKYLQNCWDFSAPTTHWASGALYPLTAIGRPC